MRDIIGEFEKRGVKVLGVVAEDPELLRKYLTFHDTPFRVLNDKAREIIAAYGLLDDSGPPYGIIAKPAYLALDHHGVARYLYISRESSDMPDDREVLEVFDGMLNRDAPGTRRSRFR